MDSLTLASTAGSVGFAVAFFIASIRIVDARAWCLAPLMLSAFLETVGFVCLTYHSLHPANHIMFFLSFASTSLAPYCLALANALALNRLISFTSPNVPTSTPNRSQQIVFYLTSLAPLAAGLVLCLLGLIDTARFLSPSPIHGIKEASQRLVFHDRGMQALANSQLILLVALTSLALTTLYLLHQKTSTGAKDMVLFKLWSTISLVNASLWLRSACKVAALAFSEPNMLDLTSSSNWFWIDDALPMLVAITLYCGMHPQHLMSPFSGDIRLASDVPISVATHEKGAGDYHALAEA